MSQEETKDTYAALPSGKKINPFKYLDGLKCWAGEMTAPMPSHPLPVAAKLPDDFTPEMFVAARCIASGALRPGSDKAEIITDAIYNDGEDAIVTAERYNVIYLNGWDDGKSAEGGYCPAKERNEARTRRIVDQVRFAPNQHMLNRAFDASCYYSAELHMNLAQVYGMKFCTAKTVEPLPTPEPRPQAAFSDFP